MTLPTGARLGAYEIRGPLGAGGMGEVYRAWDERLGREVAVKVLPPAAASDPDRRRRFEQEARAAGALNHPNVLAVHDVGSHESAPFIVSELLEGDTLRGRLRAGGLTSRKAVEHAIQIAHGLAAAHQRGIVHRDLKPENVFVTRDGHAKILDFGLAKLRPETERDPQETGTLDTRPGEVLGTVGYMSPEQVRGLPADARSDIFALGAILYEMLARRRAFVGETTAEVDTAILREEPPELPTIDRGIPPSLDRIVRRCLEKRPEERFETARDVAFALEAVATRSTESGLPVQGSRGWRARWALGGGLVAGLLLGALALTAVRRPPPPPTYTPLTFRRGTIVSARFTNDGQTVVYSAAWEGQPAQVYSTRIGSHEARPLGLEGIVLSVSAKDEVAVKLGRFRGKRDHGVDDRGTLARVPLEGGPPRELLDDVTVADWDPEGRDIAVVHPGRLEYPIGHVVYRPENGMFAVRALPEGRFAIVEALGWEGASFRFGVSLVDAAGKRTVLSPGWLRWWELSWSPATQEALFVASRGEGLGIHAVSLRGRERLVAPLPGDFALHDVDRRGRLLLERRSRRLIVSGLPPGEARERDLSWLDWTTALDLSADGRLVLLIEYGGPSAGNQTMYLRKTDGSPPVALSEDNGLALSPDGRFVLALPGQEWQSDHLVLVPTGVGSRRELRHGSLRFEEAAAWFPDGRRIVVVGREPPAELSRLFVWDVDGSAPPRPLSPEGRFSRAVVSADGRSVAVAVRGDRPVLVPVDGGPSRPVPGGAANEEPLRWTSDGRWLYLRRCTDSTPLRCGLPAWIDRIEIATGTRQPWKELMPGDPTGVHGCGRVLVTPDGKSYVYTIGSSIGSLYLAEGLR
jgi:eukaryotic-like serine/threonine-protein kinase